MTGWLVALVRSSAGNGSVALGEPPSDENAPGVRMRSELFGGHDPQLGYGGVAEAWRWSATV